MRRRSVTKTTSEIKETTPEVNIKFWLAASECNYHEISSLFRHDPDLVNWQDPLHKMSALHYACKYGDTSIVKLLLGTYKSDPNLITTAGKTALHYAVEFNHIECAKLLKDVYNVSSEITDYSGLLPIHYASADSYPIYYGLLGSKKGFNKITPLFKKNRTFDFSPMKLLRRVQSKDETDAMSPRIRFTFPGLIKDNRGAVYIEEGGDEI